MQLCSYTRNYETNLKKKERKVETAIISPTTLLLTHTNTHIEIHAYRQSFNYFL